jgi:hypothetical protein
MGTADAWQYAASLSSRANMPITWSVRGSYFDDSFGGYSYTGATTLTVRPASRWQASVDPTYTRQVDSRQFITTRTDGAEVTYGNRYIFAYIERSTVSARFRLNYAFTPNFTVEAYAEPFASSGRFHDFGELSAPSSDSLRRYGGDGTGTSLSLNENGTRTVNDGDVEFTLPRLDFTRLSFRSNIVLRWEWLPGSTAFLIWQQSRFNEDPVSRLVSPRGLLDATSARGDNFLVMKASFWIG